MASLMVLAIGPTAFADETKIGHVDLMRVLEAYRQSDPASIRLQEEVARKKKEFDLKKDAIVLMRETIERQESKLTAEEMMEKKRTLNAESEAMIALMNEAKRDLQAKGEFLQSTLSKVVRSAIAEIAKEGHYHYILDGRQRPVLFSEDSLDVTDALIEKIMKDQ
jgi:Skp family chaperone for outer membrane proteins